MAVISKLEAVLLQGSRLRFKAITPVPAWPRFKHSKLGGNTQDFHVTSVSEYPTAKSIPLPSNIEDINSTEKSRFSPERSRDITGSLISTSSGKTDFPSPKQSQPTDARIASYDCSGAVSLNSAMQTNVPEPFSPKGKATHLNMPGGQWQQGQKYVSEDLNNSHPVNTRNDTGAGFSPVKKPSRNSFLMSPVQLDGSPLLSSWNIKHFSSVSTPPEQEAEKNTPAVLSRKDQLKAAVKDYGAVVIVFHVGISLASLGICYVAVTSGIDFSSLLGRWGYKEGAAAATTAAPFIVAYAIHKSFAPVRITTTLVSVPFIVKYLRRIGFIKKPVPKN